MIRESINEGAGFARSQVGPWCETFEKAHKSAHLRCEFLVSGFWFLKKTEGESNRQLTNS
jgi:hypothetical protein